MSRRASSRLAPALVACLLLSLLPACRGAEKTSAIPGALPVSLDSLSADSLVAFASSLKYVGQTTVPRRCDDDAVGCAGNQPAQTARVTISATDGAWTVNPGKLPANGVLIGRASATGHREARYGFKPGAPYEYFFIVLPGADPSKPTWRIEEVSGVAGQRTHKLLSQGPYQGCTHAPWTKPPTVPVGFYSCDRSPHLAADGTTQSQLTQADPALTDPAWFGCGTGCCIMAS